MPAPTPPIDLSRRALPFVTVNAGLETHRLNGAAVGATFYANNTGGRLNAPAGECGVMYVAENAAGAFAEPFFVIPVRH